MFRFLISLLMITFVAQPVLAGSKDAVYDERSGFVYDKWGKCVRTKWMGEEDPCAPPAPEPEPVVEIIPEPEPAPEPEPVEMVSKEERTVYFGFDSATIDAEELTKIATLAETINASKSVNAIRVVGFTDQTGGNAYNLKLSNKRVQAVMDALNPLVTLEVEKERMDLRGAGKAPDSGCKTLKSLDERKACKRKERRVEVLINRSYMELR